MPPKPHDVLSDRALRARIAAHESWARTIDRTGRTASARKAFRDRFLDQVPEEITDPEERAKAAENLRKAFYTRLALKSAQARRQGAKGRTAANTRPTDKQPPTRGGRAA